MSLKDKTIVVVTGGSRGLRSSRVSLKHRDARIAL